MVRILQPLIFFFWRNCLTLGIQIAPADNRVNETKGVASWCGQRLQNRQRIGQLPPTS